MKVEWSVVSRLKKYIGEINFEKDLGVKFISLLDDNKFDEAVAEEKVAMEKEINRLNEIAKRPLELQRENDQLKSQLIQEKDRYDKLALESEVLKSPMKDRQWFVSGALVVFGSMIFGIILTRIPWQRKKKWNQL